MDAHRRNDVSSQGCCTNGCGYCQAHLLLGYMLLLFIVPACSKDRDNPWDPHGINPGQHDIAIADQKVTPDQKAMSDQDTASPWDPECKKDLSSIGYACRTDNKYGQSGYCIGWKFTRIRYCFKGAPCDPASGICKPSGGCSACPSTGGTCTTTCTSFITYTKTLQSCCVGASDNGSGDIGSACSAHTNCKSGLCRNKGTCFVPCSLVPVDSCPTGYWCGPVKITLGLAPFNTSGCTPLAADSGVDSVPKPDSHLPDIKPSAPGTWVTIKAGTFQMGSPDGTGTQPKESCRYSDETQHQVTLTHKFEIMTTEVTQGQFQQVMGYSPSYFSSCGSTCPVEGVSWNEAAAYANAMSAKAGKAKCYACTGSGKSVTCAEATAYAGKGIYACKGYRLPTEAEWEYAYRAGTSTAFYNGGITSCSGGADPNLAKIGWYFYNSSNRTHPVGQKTANAWGLSDMAGNVWEWCHDRAPSSYGSSAVTDPWGSSSGSDRVLRGGSWNDFPSYMRAANRFNYAPAYRGYGFGFRCARTKN